MANGQAGKTIGALVGTILAAIGLAEVGLVIVRALVPPAALATTNDVIGNYLQTLGTIYAVLLAFIVFVVWSQFNDARQYVEREANELVDLFRTGRALPSPRREQLHAALADYVDGVLDGEWQAMACNDRRLLDDRSNAIDGIWDTIADFRPTNDAEQVIYSDLMARINDLSDMRANRLTSACLRVPLALRVFLYTGAVMTLGSMYLFAIEHWHLHAILVAAMAGMLSHLLYVIRDLDNCFAGDWQVPRAAFDRLKAQLAATRSDSD
jgi:hypothetical protein